MIYYWLPVSKLIVLSLLFLYAKSILVYDFWLIVFDNETDTKFNAVANR